jgi:hypothetical protein
MKSISLRRWWMIIGLASLLGNDLYGQNSFPSSGDAILGFGNKLKQTNSIYNLANLIWLDGSNFVGVGGINSNGIYMYNGNTMVLSVRGYNVGIGTDWASEKLEVTGTVKCSGILFPDNTRLTSANGVGGGSGQWTSITGGIFYSGGKVGIGKTPDYNLDVNGTIRCTQLMFPDGTIQSTAGGGGGGTSQWISSGSGIYYPSGTVAIGAHQAGANDIRMDLGGSITHTWNGGSDSRYILSSNGQLDLGFPVGWDAGALKLRGSSNGYAIITGGGAAVNGGEGELLFFTNSQNSSPQVVFRGSGNVGIGTASPAQKLDVAGAIAISGNSVIDVGRNVTAVGGTFNSLTVSGSSGLTLSAGPVYMGNNTAIWMKNASGTSGAIMFADASNNLNIGDYSNAFAGNLIFRTTGQTRMSVLANGNVGVGTMAPGQKLSVSGTIESTAGGFKFPDGTIQTTAASGGTGQWSTNGININNSNSGNVGIGTSSPSQKLDVAGSIAVSGTSVIDVNRNIVNVASGAFAGNVNVGGSVIIGNRTTTSYKLDIVGNVRANEVVVNTDGSDFVFEEGYGLMDLASLAEFVRTNKHLPDIAPADEMQKAGVGIGEMQTKLLQKIEELTLYMIDQEKRIQEQNRRIEKLERENEGLRSRTW